MTFNINRIREKFGTTEPSSSDLCRVCREPWGEHGSGRDLSGQYDTEKQGQCPKRIAPEGV